MSDQDSTKQETNSISTTHSKTDETSVLHALGDLEDAEKSTSLNAEHEHELGNVNAMAEDQDNADAGDFALLDEAIAELENDESIVDQNIPTLSDIVEPDSQAMTDIDEMLTEVASGAVPTLNHVATEAVTPENTPQEEPHSEISSAAPASKAESFDSGVATTASSTTPAAAVSAIEESDTTEPPKSRATRHSALEFNSTNPPPEEEMFTASELILAEDETQESYSRPARSAEHHVNLGGENSAGLSISIPYTLHSQLSKKIDNLVIEATTSMTNELHHQLTLRLNGLLAQSVEAVLPKLIDQMAHSLRDEVNHQVKQQLPNIINEVLGKTSISK